MKEWFRKRTLSGQIRFFYILLFLLMFLLCGAAYFVTSHSLVSSSEDSTLEYGLEMAEANLEALLDNVNDDSKILAFSEVVQQSLQAGDSLEYEERLKLQEAVTRMAASCDGISSICLFDDNGEVYTAGNVYEVEKIRAGLDTIFESASEESAGDSAILFYPTYLDESRKMISFVRQVRDLDTLDVLGVLAVNIPVDRIEETFAQTADQYQMEIVVLDRDGEVIAKTDGGDSLAEILSDSQMEAGREYYQEISFDGEKYKAGMLLGEAWSIAGAIPRNQTLSSLRTYTVFLTICICIGLALCIFGAYLITCQIDRPLKNILGSMNEVKNGKLIPVSVIETNREIDALQQQYNRMLDETGKLMTQKVEEQRLRRKYELSLLQAQIKPHFLYNTFDSVCALAMMGKTKDVYTMMQALGQYYRKSLHKGQQIIPVKEELEIVENYLIIQSYRYDDVFEVEYDVDESVKTCKTIKLILQPLVENAIYHGFRENDIQGTITIRAKDVGEYVKLEVEDDGIGMEKEKLKEILSRTEENQGRRFGLFGTIQRINLYYGQEDRSLVDIKSEPGRGTCVTVMIPKGKEE